jgi:hypothetical protein
MRKFLLFVFLIVSFQIFGQKLQLLGISLKVDSSISLFSDLKIEIINDYINPQKIGNNAIIKVIKYSKKEKKYITNEFILDEKAYFNICEKISKINPVDIFTEKKKGVVIDGSLTELIFANEDESITYRVYGLGAAKENSELMKLKNLVIEILNVANEKRYGFNK